MIKNKRHQNSSAAKDIKVNNKKARLWKWVRRNSFNILLLTIAVLIFFSPAAKSWALQKLMLTGFFNAHIENTTGSAKKTDKAGQESVDGPPPALVKSFSFENKTGEALQISDLKGKVVFINFWATWCPPCRAELPSIQRLYDQFKGQPEVVFLLLNEDSPRDFAAGKVDAFMHDHRYRLPVYRLRTPPDSRTYAGTLPTTLVLDKQGRVRYRKEGFADYSSKSFAAGIKKMMQAP